MFCCTWLLIYAVWWCPIHRPADGNHGYLEARVRQLETLLEERERESGRSLRALQQRYTAMEVRQLVSYFLGWYFMPAFWLSSISMADYHACTCSYNLPSLCYKHSVFCVAEFVEIVNSIAFELLPNCSMCSIHKVYLHSLTQLIKRQNLASL